MKVKLCVGLFIGGLVIATQAMAVSPAGNPFLSVDLNAANTGGGQAIGPTQAGYQPWDIVRATDAFNDPLYGAPNNWAVLGPTGMSKPFVTTEGIITATLTGISTNSEYNARNRTNEDSVAPPPSQLALERDFIYVQTTPTTQLGRNQIKLELTGLIPNQAYRIDLDHRDINFLSNTVVGSYQAATDRAALGGLDGPVAWLDANVGVGMGYDSTETAPAGYKNPIPTKSRSRNAGQNYYGSPFTYVDAFRTLADGTGKVTVYTWTDSDTYDGNNSQRATVLNGFELAKVPEPSSIVLFAIALGGLAVLRRKTR